MKTSAKVSLISLPFSSFLEKEIRRFLRVAGQTLLIPLINTMLYLLIFGVGLGKSIAQYHGYPYLAFLIPGLVMMGILNNAFQNSSSSISISKFHGDIEDWKVVPLTDGEIITALTMGALFRGLLVGLIVLVAGEIFYYVSLGELLPIANPLALIYFLLVGGASFGLLGISVAFRAKNFDQMAAIGGFVLLPLIYLGGVFFSLDHLHPIWKMISKLNPLLYLINGVRYGVLGVSDTDVVFSAGFGALTILILYWLARRSIQRGHFSRW